MNKSGLLSMLAGVLSILHFSEVNGGIIIAGTDNVGCSYGDFRIEIFDSFLPGGFTQDIRLSSGSFSIKRQQQVGLGDGTGSISTELLGVTLTGNSDKGPLSVRVGADNGVQQGASLGAITNVITTDPGSPVLVGPEAFVSGDSFFNVLFEIDVAGMHFYNRDFHVTVAPEITALPPIGSKHVPPRLVPLYFRVGNENDPNDPIIGYAGGSHFICPEPASFAVLSLGFLAAAIVARKRRRRQLAIS